MAGSKSRTSTAHARGKRKRNRKRPAPRRRSTAVGARAFETILASLAHEIRTPLTGILALGELLLTSELGERERRWVVALKSAAEHLAALTTVMVDGARAAAKGLVLRSEVFHLRRMAEALASSLEARAQANGLIAETLIADDLPERARGDATRLRAAVENLLDNAVKFTDSGKVALDVSAEPLTGGRVRVAFSVADSGIGMTPGEIRRLFRPYAQANETIAKKFGGTGLGLVLIERLAKAMDGTLIVESKPGHGSTFRLSVMLESAADIAAEPSDQTGELASAGAGRLRILCAEDNPYGRIILNTILSELGHRPDFVGTGDAAIEAVRRGGYDLVLMDIVLGGMDGFEATRRIRALPDSVARIPVIGISGHTTPVDEAAARAAGMDGYLRKPVGPRALAQALAAVMSQR